MTSISRLQVAQSRNVVRFWEMRRIYALHFGMDKSWFELKEIRRRRLSDAVWIPLYVSEQVETQGNYG